MLLRFLRQVDQEKLCEGFVEAARTAIAGGTPQAENLGVQRLEDIETVTRWNDRSPRHEYPGHRDRDVPQAAAQP